MGMHISTLASSSSGNSSIVFTEKTKILIDAGISRLKIQRALKELNITFDDLDAILLTHAHSDHVAGIPVLIKHTKCPIICSQSSLNVMLQKSKFQHLREYEDRFRFYDGSVLSINDLDIEYFRLPHDGWLINRADDAGDNYGFIFSHYIGDTEYRLGYITDLGHFPEHLYEKYFNCDFYVIESNHDIELQKQSERPLGLIKRNLSKFGHLSNEQAASAVCKLIHPRTEFRKTKSILLAHLSKECNSYDMAYQVMKKELEAKEIGNLGIYTAPYSDPSGLFRVKMGKLLA